MNTTQKIITIATFYRFAAVQDVVGLQAHLKREGVARQIKGSILVAKEGINATISGDRQDVLDMISLIEAVPGMEKLPCQMSESFIVPFKRYFVKIKPEIVALGCPETNPANQRTGTYVTPAEWNALLADPDVVVLDVRNDYEVEMGTFKGAVNPHTAVFKEFPDYVERTLDPKQNKKVAMCCTGGIRCEKASAWMLEQGFEEVYHLKGGILTYLNEMPAEESAWQGECFVFDDRITF